MSGQIPPAKGFCCAIMDCEGDEVEGGLDRCILILGLR